METTLIPRSLPQKLERAWKRWSCSLWCTICGFTSGFDNWIIAYTGHTQRCKHYTSVGMDGWYFWLVIFYFRVFRELSHSQKLNCKIFVVHVQSKRTTFQSILLGTIYLAANRSVSMSVPLMAIAEAKITNHTVDRCHWDYRSALEVCSTTMCYVARW